MKNRVILLNTIIYTIIIIIILFLYEFITKNFSKEFSLIIIFIIVLIIGYSFIEFLLEPIIIRDKILNRVLKDTLHELNIPIATIRANITMLEKTIKSEKELKRLNRIKKATDRLLIQYENLDYYIKKGIKKVEKEKFDIKEVILDEVSNFKSFKKGIKITTSLYSYQIYADKNGFIQTISNLLSNAIKYNREGGFVNIILKENRLIIEDNGIGMDEIEIIKIFDRYYQSNPSEEGYGIGLNIVKYFCDEHKIKINIISKKGEGTKFILDLNSEFLKG